MPSNSYRGLVVIIPTRNRASLCINAIRSVLRNPIPELQVLVSDNSTLDHESQALSRFCSGLHDPRLLYIKPPEPLAMFHHFDWVYAQAAALSEANHFTCLTDRMMLKSGAAKSLCTLAARHPDDVTCFLWDSIYDDETPVRVEQHAWCGKLFRVQAAELLRLAAQVEEHYAPKLTNCITPRSVLQDVRDEFGDLCVSLTPDICFGYRCLTTLDAVLHYDKALFLQYGMNRSNASNLAKGTLSPDTTDFLAYVQGTCLNYAAPAPELLTTANCSVHEYCLVQQRVGKEKLPDVNMNRYWWKMGYLIRDMESAEQQQRMMDVMASYGHPMAPCHQSADRQDSPPASLPRRVVNKVSWELRGPAAKPLWLLLFRLFRWKPPQDQRFPFSTTEEAIRYVNRVPCKPEDVKKRLWEFEHKAAALASTHY